MSPNKDVQKINYEQRENEASQAINKIENLKGLTWTIHEQIKNHLKKNTSLGKFITDGESSKEIKSNADYSIYFSEPVFISYLKLTYEENPLNFKIECVDLFEKRTTHAAQKTNSKTRKYQIKKATQEIRIVGDSNLFSKKRILTDLSIVGSSASSLDEAMLNFESTLRENSKQIDEAKIVKEGIENDLQTLYELVQHKDDLLDEIEGVTKEISDSKIELDSVKDSIESLTSDRLELATNNKLLTNNNQSLQNSSEQLEADRKRLNGEISDLKQELKLLQEDKNAFTEDVIEFNKRSNEQKSFYLRFSSYLIITILALAGIIFNSALNTASSIPSWNEAINIFVARLPLLSMTIVISLTCFYLIKGFFIKIMDVDRQQLNFAKLGIVAKDVSVYASEGLEDIDEEMEFERRIRLKMDLLKDFLSEELGKQYDYAKKADEQLDKAMPSWARSFLERFEESKNDN